MFDPLKSLFYEKRTGPCKISEKRRLCAADLKKAAEEGDPYLTRAAEVAEALEI